MLCLEDAQGTPIYTDRKYFRGCLWKGLHRRLGGLWTLTANGCGVLFEEKDENAFIRFKFGADFAQPCQQIKKAFEWHTK